MKRVTEQERKRKYSNLKRQMQEEFQIKEDKNKELEWLKQFQRETDYLNSQQEIYFLLSKHTNLYLLFILFCVFALGFIVGVNLGTFK